MLRSDIISYSERIVEWSVVESSRVTTTAMGLGNSSKDMGAEERRGQKAEPCGTLVS